jgi:uncharacterized membrane protein
MLNSNTHNPPEGEQILDYDDAAQLEQRLFINNNVLWVIAFILPIGGILEQLLWFLFTDDGELYEGELQLITFALMIGLCIKDIGLLKRAGVRTTYLPITAVFFAPLFFVLRYQRTKSGLVPTLIWFGWVAISLALILFIDEV